MYRGSHARPALLHSIAAFILSCYSVFAASLGARHGVPATLADESLQHSLLRKCSKEWFDADLDHFGRTSGPKGETSFKLRYFVCDEHYRNGTKDDPPGPIFFYLGNESDVLLYLNATGLMWENAEAFGAMLIFAEHRYYGESLPFGDDTYDHMQWLSSEQALGDYASLLYHFRRDNGIEDAPVIGFGGSYGGMLAAWARLKYPFIWQGAIAGSAPIWTFEGERPAMDPLFYSKTVTFDTSVAAGAPPGCTDTLRSGFQILTASIEQDKADSASRSSDTAHSARARRLHATDRRLDGTADAGASLVREEFSGLKPKEVSEAMNICSKVQLNTTEDVRVVRDWAAAAFDMMAMGNYPYSSSYMLNGHGELPAFPMRVACTNAVVRIRSVPARPASLRVLQADSKAQPVGGPGRPAASQEDLLAALAAAASVWYNYTGDADCFNPWKGVNEETAKVGNLWDYQWCTEQFMPMAKSGVADIYWREPFDKAAAFEGCKRSWGVEPRPHWGTVQWGGKDLSTLSNVVFSNGLYDPWHLGGVLQDLSASVKAVIIPEGGHHLDLFFSNDNDPDSVKQAREVEVANIKQWIDEYHKQRRHW